ncbi:MAG: cobalamin-dependent protein [Pseudomonadota bacterium]
MSVQGKISALTGNSALGFGTAALRRAIANPLKRRKSPEPKTETIFNTCASYDPVCSVLERDIIPRLLMAHIVDGAVQPSEERDDIESGKNPRFSDLPMRLDAPNLIEEVDRLLEQGLSIEDVYLDMLAPAARYMGELWEADECDFVDVTMGLWRLQEVMRELSTRAPAIPSIDNPRSAVFCPVPGDVHYFGAQMIEEVFARAGWQSEVLLKPERRELLDYLAHKPVDLIGLTVSRNNPASAIASLIKAIRSVSANPNLSILIGGHMINQNPHLVAEVGADGTGQNARDALAVAERLVREKPARAHSLV